ncbi:exonuclease domain-containing protein [Glycomyces sp. NPDC047369]
MQEIAVIEVDSGAVLFDRRLNPGEPISGGARRIHSISDADVADSLPFAAVAEDLAASFRGRRIIIYNADVDLRVLAREARRARRLVPGSPVDRAAAPRC